MDRRRILNYIILLPVPTLLSSGIFCFEEPPRELPLASLSSLPVKRSQLTARLNTTESMTLLICFFVTAPKRWLPWLTEPLGLPPPFLELLFFFSSFWAGSAASASVGIQYDTIRYDTIRYDTIRYDTIPVETLDACLATTKPLSSKRLRCSASAWASLASIALCFSSCLAFSSASTANSKGGWKHGNNIYLLCIYYRSVVTNPRSPLVSQLPEREPPSIHPTPPWNTDLRQGTEGLRPYFIAI